MKKNLQERYARYDARFPLNEVYLTLPRAVRNDAYLYLLALSGHQRANEGDENVPMTIAEELARVMGLKADRMLSALESVVRDGKSRVLTRTKSNVRLEKYAKWQDLPDEIAELKAKRSEAGQRGGLNSARARAAQANAEPNAQANGEASATASAQAKTEQPLQHQSKQIQAEREGETEREIRKRGDNAVLEEPPPGGPSTETLAVKVVDWLIVSRGSGSFESKQEQEQELAVGRQLVGLGLEFDDLMARLKRLRADADPDEGGVSSLKYFYGRLQDEAHDALKQQGRAHARTAGPTKLSESLPDIQGKKAMKA